MESLRKILTDLCSQKITPEQAEQLIKIEYLDKMDGLVQLDVFRHLRTGIPEVIFAETRGPRKPAVMEKTLIGKNASAILSKIGVHVNDDIRLVIAPVEQDHPLVWTEQMMPVLPVVRMPNADAAIDIAVEAEHGFGHTAVMHSKNLDNLSRMAREINCSIFVKNGPSLAGLGYGGEGYCSFSIASPTGEGITTARSFSRERRCVLVDHFRIV